jgi:ribonuclease HI
MTFDNINYIIYTDGACLGNPGKGGWAAIIIEPTGEKEIVGCERSTTNNRMELKAVIEALKEIEANSQISLFSDSKYVIDGITKWIKNWKINDWKTTNKKEIKNLDLWMDLDKLTSKFKITWNWVKAHSTNEYNNKVDRLARNEAEKIS